MTQHVFGHAAEEEMLQSGSTVRSHDDHVAFPLLSHPTDDLTRYSRMLESMNLVCVGRASQHGIQLQLQVGVARMLLTGQGPRGGSVEGMEQEQIRIGLAGELLRIHSRLRCRDREVNGTQDLVDCLHGVTSIIRLYGLCDGHRWRLVLIAVGIPMRLKSKIEPIG
jgi:hypothetical protein